jgi:hypothetical protein
VGKLTPLPPEAAEASRQGRRCVFVSIICYAVLISSCLELHEAIQRNGLSDLQHYPSLQCLQHRYQSYHTGIEVHRVKESRVSIPFGPLATSKMSLLHVPQDDAEYDKLR